MDINDLLTFAVAQKASDLHLSAGMPPMLRIDGDIRRIEGDTVRPLSHEQVRDLLYSAMNDAQRKVFEATLECDFSLELIGVSRFRANAFVQHRGYAAVFRTIPSHIPTLDDLQAPALFKTIALLKRGLVLVTGPTGTGKSTTLAAMIDHINKHQHHHILTVEDPIEFVHTPDRSLINQREVGANTLSFNNALREGLREDPDVFLVGELRDLETTRLAIEAAATGHLVFGTLHTSSAAGTVNRIIDMFPAGEKDNIRSSLAESLAAVISQCLLKRKDGHGRLAVHEILLQNTAVKNLIRKDNIPQIYSTIQSFGKDGMITLEQSLDNAVRSGKVSNDEAREYAKEESKDNFR